MCLIYTHIIVSEAKLQMESIRKILNIYIYGDSQHGNIGKVHVFSGNMSAVGTVEKKSQSE